MGSRRTPGAVVPPVHNQQGIMGKQGRSPKRKIRILIVDREPIFRLGMKRLLGLEDDLRVSAEAENSAQAIEMARQFAVDMAFVQAEVMNERTPGLLTRFKELSPEPRVVITFTSLDDAAGLQCVQDGAAGYILKSVDPALFVKCARKVIENEIWVPKRQVAQMAQAFQEMPSNRARPADTLTQREKTIVSYLVQGWRNRDIAGHLSISEQTVKNHLRAVYDKVGVSDRLELVLYAIHHQLDLPAAGLTPAGTTASKA